MTRAALLAACLLLAACAPVVYVTPGAGDVLLPEQAQRALDAYTATARVVATQAAGATATDSAARATATSAAQATQGSLAVEQTRAALSLTSAAGAAMSTDMAAQRTQTAQDTRQARQQAAAGTYAAQTPTAAAWGTQNALGATQAAAAVARGESAAEFWTWVRWTTVAALIGLALVVVALVLARGAAYVMVETQREQARTAREAFRILPGYWAEWQPGDGYRVYLLPDARAEPDNVIDQTPTAPDRAHEWRHAVRLFAWWGERYGFGLRDLGAEGAGIVTDPGWRRLSRLLRGAGVLAEEARRGGRVTAWAPGWDYRALADALATRRLALPYPADEEPPKVAFAVPTQQGESTQHEPATQVGTR